MKKLYLTIGWFALVAGALHAQNVGIGTATPAIRLDVAGGFATSVTNATSANTLVIPANTSVYRIEPGGGATANMSLTASGPVEGQRLLIINDHATYSATFAGATIAAGGGSGSFTYIGGAWRYFGGSPSATAWNLTGNAGTNPTTNYIGTSDGQPLSIRTAGIDRINITAAGLTVINSTQANANFRVASQGDANAIFLNASNSRVGLGTALPAERLHVEGNARLTALAGDVNVNIGTGTGYGFVSADANGTLGKLVAPNGTLDLWYRPTGQQYIRPISNNSIRVYDSGQTWGFYYDGNTNRLANYSLTKYAPPANTMESGLNGYSAAVIGFSDVQLNGNNLVSPALPAETGPNQTYGYLGYVGDFNMGSAGVIRGSSVYGTVEDPNRVALFGRTTNNANYAACIGYSNVWIASYNLVDNISGSYNPPAAYAQLNITNNTLPGFQIALRGYQNRGTTGGNPGYSVGAQGLANSQNQDAFGVMGLAYCNTTTRAGGYFEALTYPGTSQAFAYVGTSVGGVNRKITGTAAVSEIIPTENHGRIMLTCPEAPEYWYQDYGSVKMVNGRAHVDLDPILADIIVVNEDYPVRVFCTPVDMTEFNGVAVVNRTSTGFDLVELNGGSHTCTIDYQIVVKPKTGYGEGRFPQAPGPAYLKADKEPLAAKAKNQPDPSKIFYWPADHIVYKYNPEDHVAVGDVVPAGPNAGKFKLGNGRYSDTLPVKKVGNGD